MYILSLDPSSTCVGYAVMKSDTRGLRLVEGGRMHGKAGTSPDARMLAVRPDLIAVLNQFLPSHVLVEMPLQKQYTREQGKRSGLPVWGMAAGSVWAWCVAWAEDQNCREGPSFCRVHAIDNGWTKGKTKDDRQLAAKIEYPGYDAAKDRGMDVSDAIGMAGWWSAINAAEKETR